MSLYQKVRPKTLDAIIGNSVVIKAISDMLKSRYTTHAFLLTGSIGTGKTTIGRILAKHFSPDEMGILEKNIPNNGGVEVIREISDSIKFKTVTGGTKVYLFDEAHEFSNKAQADLFKVLEDTPEYCYFILCTTDPQKIEPAIRNRCTEYHLSKLNNNELHELLDRTCKSEKLNVSKEIKEAIVQTCDGSPRAALVALEKVIGITNLDEAIELVLKDTELDKNIIDLCKLLMLIPEMRKKRWKEIITTFDTLEGEAELHRKAICTFLYKKLIRCNKEKDALDIAWLLRLFSVSVFYGGKSQLGTMIIRACFEKSDFVKEVE